MKRPFTVTAEERPIITEHEVLPWIDPETAAQIIRRQKERARREGLTLIAGLLEARADDTATNRP